MQICRQYKMWRRSNRKLEIPVITRLVIIIVVVVVIGASGKEPTCQCRRHKRCGFDPWVGKICWRRKWQPTPAKFHRRRSLVGSPWGHKESDMTERLNFHFHGLMVKRKVSGETSPGSPVVKTPHFH